MKWAICGRCHGDGKIVHPALSVWTESDRREDPDGFETMMRGGYDIRCDECGGSGKVRVEDDWHGEESPDEFDYADARQRAAENGDAEALMNPHILRHYY